MKTVTNFRALLPICLTAKPRAFLIRTTAALFVCLVVVHVGLSLKSLTREHHGIPGVPKVPPSPLAMAAEQQRQSILDDPYVLIQALRSLTDEDSIIVVPDNHEGYWLDVVLPSYLLPRQVIRIAAGDPLPTEATHIVSIEEFTIDGASLVAFMSGNVALYKLPAR